MVRSKNKIQYFLPERNCQWSQILFPLYAKPKGTLRITNTKRYHRIFINCNSWWKSGQSEKTSLRNYIIKESVALHTVPSEETAWFWQYGFNKLLKAKKNYKEWISTLIRFIFPDSSITMKLLGFLNDTK